MKPIIVRCLLIYSQSGIAGLWNYILELQAETKRLKEEAEKIKAETKIIQESNDRLRKILNQRK